MAGHVSQGAEADATGVGLERAPLGFADARLELARVGGPADPVMQEGVITDAVQRHADLYPLVIVVSFSCGDAIQKIARALAVDPKFILLDEPFAGVDPIAVEEIQTIVAKLKYRNIGILITDHNVRETLAICKRAYIVNEGKTIYVGTPQEVLKNQRVREIYLGHEFDL